MPLNGIWNGLRSLVVDHELSYITLTFDCARSSAEVHLALEPGAESGDWDRCPERLVTGFHRDSGAFSLMMLADHADGVPTREV